MAYGIILRCGQLFMAQREFDHLCEKAQWPKAICSHVLIEKEIQCIFCLIIFLLRQNDKIKQEKHNRILCLDTAQAELFTEMNNNNNNI